MQNSQSSLFAKIAVLLILATAGYILYRKERGVVRNDLRAVETVGLMSSQDIMHQQLDNLKTENTADLLTDGRTTVISTAELRRKELLRRRQGEDLDQVLGAYEARQEVDRKHSREMDDHRRRLANEQYEQLEHSNNHLIKTGQQGGANASNVLHTVHQENARREQAETMNWANISSRAATQNMQNAQAQHDMEVLRAEAEAAIEKAANELGSEEEGSTLDRWMREGIEGTHDRV
jgi:ABC-type nickel/cobalt efflux system permease component RcnA